MKIKVPYAKPLAEVLRILDTDLTIFARTRTLDELTDLFIESFGACVVAGEDDAETIRFELYRRYYVQEAEMPWCKACRSYHVAPINPRHKQMLKCRAV